MLQKPFYDPERSYEENFEQGPFGAFADGEAFENNGEPAYDFFGIPVFSPFGIPAGPLLNGRFAQAALDKGFDVVTYKTVRSRKYPSHPWPNVLSVKVEGDLPLGEKLVADKEYREPLSITNSFGVPSLEPEFWQEDMRKIKTRQGQVLVGAFQGTGSTEDFVETARLLKETGVKVMEVNFSCPNEGTNNLLCYDTARSAEVAKAIKREIGDIPLIVKIGYFTDPQPLVREIGGVVDGISAINTIAAEVVDENGNQALPGEGRLKSGVCGHAIRWAGLDMAKKLKNIRDGFGYGYKIIGVGGVMNFQDFKEYRDTGADYVMSATGAMWNPYLAQEIKQELLRLKY